MRVLLLALALLNPIQRLDEAVARQLQAMAGEQRAHDSAWPAVMAAATSWGRPVVVIGGLVVVVAADVAGGNGWGLARLAVASLAGTNLAVELGKRAVNRTRPDGEHKRSNSSFPSSHAANAFTLAWVLSARWRRGWPAFAALATLVAFSRLYLNRHYLSDVVAGAALGAAIAWAAQCWLASRTRPEAPDREGPAGGS
jgi:membrane-associated phospholipid phosphatase